MFSNVAHFHLKYHVIALSKVIQSITKRCNVSECCTQAHTSFFTKKPFPGDDNKLAAIIKTQLQRSYSQTACCPLEIDLPFPDIKFSCIATGGIQYGLRTLVPDKSLQTS